MSEPTFNARYSADDMLDAKLRSFEAGSKSGFMAGCCCGFLIGAVLAFVAASLT